MNYKKHLKIGGFFLANIFLIFMIMWFRDLMGWSVWIQQTMIFVVLLIAIQIGKKIEL